VFKTQQCILVPHLVIVSQTQVVINRGANVDVTVTCTVQGTGPFYIQWQRRRRNITEEPNESVYQEADDDVTTETFETRSSTLFLRNVSLFIALFVVQRYWIDVLHRSIIKIDAALTNVAVVICLLLKIPFLNNASIERNPKITVKS